MTFTMQNLERLWLEEMEEYIAGRPNRRLRPRDGGRSTLSSNGQNDSLLKLDDCMNNSPDAAFCCRHNCCRGLGEIFQAPRQLA